jgi:hypothetical protein
MELRGSLLRLMTAAYSFNNSRALWANFRRTLMPWDTIESGLIGLSR